MQNNNWPRILTVFGVGVVAAFLVGKAPAALPVLRHELDLTLFQAGLVVSMFALVAAVFGIFFGALSDRLGQLRIAVCGIVVSATGTTAGHLGTAWAWYMISPKWKTIFGNTKKPKAYSLMSQLNNTGQPMLYKIALLMTDGVYNQKYSGDSSTTQARAICDNMKAKGIVVYTVGFAISVGSTPDLTMQQCASSSAHYYNASDGNALKQVFRDIALKISTLRLSE